jgi:uncharacterized membrane protein YhhN
MLTTILSLAVVTTAAATWVAVAKGWKKLEYLSKPITVVFLLGTLIQAGGLRGTPLVCFGLGLLFSLAGDVFLMISYARLSNRWFLAGLSAFFLAHVVYIIALNLPFGTPSPVWAIGLGLILAITAGRVLRRILAGVRAKGLPRLVRPVMVYGMVITIMLLSAFLTIYRPDWKTSASGLVCLGASLFYFSDLLLAWNKFVKPVRNGRLMNMAAYHLGQMALIAGAVIQFTY